MSHATILHEVKSNNVKGHRWRSTPHTNREWVLQQVAHKWDSLSISCPKAFLSKIITNIGR